MDNLKNILKELQNIGCSGIKVSFEDEGALLNEITTMRFLTCSLNIDLSVKIGGCEAKRDIVDCIHVNCDSIVAPMIESNFALTKFLQSLKVYNYNKKKGFNFETINAYTNLDTISEQFDKLDFITFGRVDFINSLNQNRESVDSDEVYNMVYTVFKKAKEHNIECYLGGAISISSKNFIKKLIDEKLLDKFETRYIIYDVSKINFSQFEKLLYLGNLFEVEWLKFIKDRYMLLATKDCNRIKMIEDRINNNKII
jgi:4-hydroxy-2-oxoheptanedioate aldolase